MNNKQEYKLEDEFIMNKEQENAITLFCEFLAVKNIHIDGDMKDDFYNWLQLKRENRSLLRVMENLNI